MDIKVLGTGCSKCQALKATVEDAIKELGIEATVTKEEDMIVILGYNVMRTPALVIDGKVVAQGKQLSLKDVKKLLS